jgi:hypothetical protein
LAIVLYLSALPEERCCSASIQRFHTALPYRASIQCFPTALPYYAWPCQCLATALYLNALLQRSPSVLSYIIEYVTLCYKLKSKESFSHKAPVASNCKTQYLIDIEILPND